MNDVNAPPKGGNKFTGWLGRTILSITGWQFEGELPNHPKMVLAVAPHTSNWDFFLGVAVLFALRIKIKFLGKHTIFVPIVKNLLESIGGIPVNRKASNGITDQVVAQFDSQSKMILALAPEGTRSPIFPWKTGFLAIAHKANVPIALVGFDFARKRIIFGPVFFSQGDFAKDMQQVYSFFSTVSAKHPNKVIYPPKS